MAEQVGGIYYEVDLDTRKMVEGQRNVTREVDKAAASFNAITAAVKLYAAAMALVKSAQMADEMRLMAARVQVAAGSLENAAAAMSALQRISVKTQTDMAASVSVFTRLNASIVQMGGNQGDTLRITELLGMAIKVSGASAVEASSAMTQFGQALGSGKLAGDELRSLLENAPYLMRQLADGLGVPIGALKQLGEEGKLTADVVTNALSKAAATIEADFRKMPQTLAGAFAVATDAAARANEAFDTLTGSSAALTGATKGVGDVLDMLAQQFANATSEGGRLGRNDLVKSWAENTALVLTYVVDAADFVVRGFRQMGTAIGGLAAAAGAAARGELLQAANIVAGMKADVLAIGNARFAGDKMRAQMAALKMVPGQDRLDRAGAAGTTSKLSAPGAAAGGKGKGSKFDALAYLSDLQQETASAYDRIGIIEQEALRKNAELLAAGKITRQQAAQASLLIETVAANDRREIAFQSIEDARQAIEEDGELREAAAIKRQDLERRAQENLRGILYRDDPLALLAFQQQAELEMLRQHAEQKLITEAELAAARIALEQQTTERIAEIVRKQRDDQAAAQAQQLQNYGNLFGSMADLVKSFGGKQNTAYKALFAASKAFAIAESIIKIQQGIANASALPFPANLAAIGSVVSATAGIVSTIKGVQYGGGRQYGGPTSAGTMYRVNELGRPEMFTASNGAQYMMPTTNGRVTAADQVGGGGGPAQINIHNYAGADIQASASPDGRVIDIAVRRAKAEIAAEISSNTGDVFRSLRSATNVQPKQG
jgi:tape measure domain-containing protein